MNERTIQLLKGAGFTKEVIDQIEKDDFNVKEAVEKFNASQKEHYQSLLRNDIEAEIKDEIIQKRDGKILADINQAIKKQGVAFDEVKDLPIPDKIKLLTEHIKGETQKSSGKVNEDYEKLQQEFLNLKNTLSEKEEHFNQQVEQIKSQSRAEVVGEKVDIRQRGKFFSIPEDRLIGKKHNEGLYMAYKSIAQTKYDFDLDENGEVVAYKKGTKTRVTGKSDEGKEHFLTVDDIMKTELKGLGLWVESNGQGSQKQETKQTTTENKQGFKSERMKELEAKLLG